MIGEVGNIILGSGATTLSGILGRKVDISTPTVEIMTLGDLKKGLSGEKVCVTIHFEGIVEGLSVLVLEKDTSAQIADIMMGGMGQAEGTELDDFKLSAVGEAMNQMMGTAATSLSDMIKNPVNITPPSVEILNFGDTTVRFPPIGEESDQIAKVNSWQASRNAAKRTTGGSAGLRIPRLKLARRAAQPQQDAMLLLTTSFLGKGRSREQTLKA